MEGSARVAVGAGTEWKWKEIGTEEFESQVRFPPWCKHVQNTKPNLFFIDRDTSSSFDPLFP